MPTHWERAAEAALRWVRLVQDAGTEEAAEKAVALYDRIARADYDAMMALGALVQREGLLDPPRWEITYRDPANEGRGLPQSFIFAGREQDLMAYLADFPGTDVRVKNLT